MSPVQRARRNLKAAQKALARAVVEQRKQIKHIILHFPNLTRAQQAKDCGVSILTMQKHARRLGKARKRGRPKGRKDSYQRVVKNRKRRSA